MIKKVGSAWAVDASWTDASGKQHRKYKGGFKLQRDAKAWEEKYLKENSGLVEDADQITLGAFLDLYLKARTPVLSPNSVHGYQVCINRIKRFRGDSKLCALKKLDYELMFSEMANDTVILANCKSGKRGKRISARTLQYAYRVLRAALNYAVEAEYLPKNPAEKVRLPVGEVKTEYKTISSEDGGRLLLALRDHDSQLYLAVLLSLVYGLRRGEALGLRWIDVDFDSGRISIRGQYTSAGNGTNAYRETLKTSSSYRVLSLHPFVAEELRAVQAANRAAGRIAEYVCELDGYLPTPNAFSQRWKKFAANQGYKGVRFHDLRHSSAMIMIHSGADINAVKQQLGHAKISTTELYLHDDFAMSASVVSNVVASLFPAPEKADENLQESSK